MKPLTGTGEVYDPGHGGPDPGAVDGIQPAEGDTLVTEEEDLTLAVALAVRVPALSRGADRYLADEGVSR